MKIFMPLSLSPTLFIPLSPQNPPINKKSFLFSYPPQKKDIKTFQQNPISITNLKNIQNLFKHCILLHITPYKNF